MNPLRPNLVYHSLRNGLLVMFSSLVMPARHCMAEACAGLPTPPVAELTIAGAPLDGVVGELYTTFTPTVEGGLGPFTFALADCVLGPDLDFDTDTGAISSPGLLTDPGTYLCEITVTDSLGTEAVLPIAFTVSSGG